MGEQRTDGSKGGPRPAVLSARRNRWFLPRAWRATLEVGEEGLVLRGPWRTRRHSWSEVEGYRWLDGRMNVYLAGKELPVNLGLFEDRSRLCEIFRARVPDLHALELAKERREIADPAALARLRRIVRPINWLAYAAAALGAAHALLRFDERVELGVASVLIAVPLVLMGLALAYPDRVRLNVIEGSARAEGLNAVLWSGLVLVLMLAFDPHTLLGRGFWLWVAPLALAYAALWLYTEWPRVRPVARSYAIVVAAISLLLMSGAWAAGSVYFVNKHADRSAVEWSRTQVTALRRKGRTAPTFLATLAPWGARREPVEIELPRATYERLRAGEAVEVGVRRGALGIAWVEEVRPEAR